MKRFDIPFQFHSPYIKQIRDIRSTKDPKKKDFTPTVLPFQRTTFLFARHFGFCYGVQNAVEIVYKTLDEHPQEAIYLLSEIIHNPEVNNDLAARGLKFIQDTNGKQLIPWDDIGAKDIVIIPAFGTTIEIENLLRQKGIRLKAYDTTCPFVERVWNKAERLSADGYTVIIHGNFEHEETRATFSRMKNRGKGLVVANAQHAQLLGTYILGSRKADEEWKKTFAPFASVGFDPRRDLDKIAVVNQTTMLASETQGIIDYFRSLLIQKFSESKIDNHFGNTRDTLCYATNDNQSATEALGTEQLDLAIIIGGYNSSNTTHLVEVLTDKCPTYFISSGADLISPNEIVHFEIKHGTLSRSMNFLPEKDHLRIGISCGASCPDAVVEEVFLKLLSFTEQSPDVEGAIAQLK